MTYETKLCRDFSNDAAERGEVETMPATGDRNASDGELAVRGDDTESQVGHTPELVRIHVNFPGLHPADEIAQSGSYRSRYTHDHDKTR